MKIKNIETDINKLRFDLAIAKLNQHTDDKGGKNELGKLKKQLAIALTRKRQTATK